MWSLKLFVIVVVVVVVVNVQPCRQRHHAPRLRRSTLGAVAAAAVRGALGRATALRLRNCLRDRVPLCLRLRAEAVKGRRLIGSVGQRQRRPVRMCKGAAKAVHPL